MDGNDNDNNNDDENHDDDEEENDNDEESVVSVVDADTMIVRMMLILSVQEIMYQNADTYRGLDNSDRDTIQEVETIVRFFPTLLSKRKEKRTGTIMKMKME